jgi:hypothetical protein
VAAPVRGKAWLARQGLEVSTAGGRFPLIRELSDPIAIGVHPAAAVEVAGKIDRVPRYIERDIERSVSHVSISPTPFGTRIAVTYY